MQIQYVQYICANELVENMVVKNVNEVTTYLIFSGLKLQAIKYIILI